MHVISIVLPAVITVSTAGLSYAVLKPAAIERDTRVVAEQASCRSVQAAIVAYVAERGRPPRSVAELAGYVQGDISAYRVAGGVATGPGC